MAIASRKYGQIAHLKNSRREFVKTTNEFTPKLYTCHDPVSYYIIRLPICCQETVTRCCEFSISSKRVKAKQHTLKVTLKTV